MSNRTEDVVIEGELSIGSLSLPVTLRLRLAAPPVPPPAPEPTPAPEPAPEPPRRRYLGTRQG